MAQFMGMMGQLQETLEVLKPRAEFFKKVKGASPNDIRIRWEVEVIRGEDELFAKTEGSSSLPSALASNRQINATTLIQQEVAEKIAAPLVCKFQDEIERLDHVSAGESADRDFRDGAEPPRLEHKAGVGPTGDPVFDLANGDPHEPAVPPPDEGKETGEVPEAEQKEEPKPEPKVPAEAQPGEAAS